MPINDDIRALVSKFSSDVERLIRSAAVEAVTAALAPAAAKVATTPRTKPVVAAKAAGKPTARPAKAARAVRVRRSPEQLQKAADAIVAHVKAHPGQGAEQIKKALSIKPADWQRPLAVALESKAIVASGERRSTTYAPRSGAVPPIKRTAH